jgi:hypothetical protein
VRLYEFAGEQRSDPLLVSLVGLLKQVQGRIEDTGATAPASLTAILSMLRANNVNISPEDFRIMVKNEPLVNIIDNIKGDQVFFHGQSETTDEVEPDDAEETISKMAKKASKKPQL